MVEHRLTNVSLASMILLLVVTLLYPFCVVVVPSGQSAVLWKRFGGGTVLNPKRLMGEGIHFILPWDETFLYDRRLQAETDTYNAISKDGVSITVTMNVRFRLNREAIPALHEAIGPDYMRLLVVPEIGNRMREVLADYTAEQIYSLDRPHIQNEILVRTQARMEEEEHLGTTGGSYVLLYDTLVLGIVLPQAVVSAIDRKVSEFYAVEEAEYRVQREREESERKQIEAEGIRNFQTTVSQGISDSYLRLRGIEATLQLAQSTNAKVVIIGGGRDGIPVILNGVDTPLAPVQAPSPAPPSAATPSAEPVAESSNSRNWLALLSSPLQPLINWFDGRSAPAHPQ